MTMQHDKFLGVETLYTYVSHHTYTQMHFSDPMGTKSVKTGDLEFTQVYVVMYYVNTVNHCPPFDSKTLYVTISISLDFYYNKLSVNTEYEPLNYCRITFTQFHILSSYTIILTHSTIQIE